MSERANPVSRILAAWRFMKRDGCDVPPAAEESRPEMPWALHMGFVAGMVRNEFALRPLIKQLGNDEDSLLVADQGDEKLVAKCRS